MSPRPPCTAAGENERDERYTYKLMETIIIIIIIIATKCKYTHAAAKVGRDVLLILFKVFPDFSRPT